MELGFSNSGPRGVTEITYLLRSHELKISELESKEQIYCNSLVQLEERIASLEYYKEKLLTRLSWTEEANSTLRSDNSKLKNLAYSLKERVDELEKDNFMLGLKMNEFAQEMERFQMQVGSTNTQMQDNLDDMAKAFESKERHVTFTQQKLADSINHHEERITTLEQDISQCTQHVQSLQVKVKSNTSQLETNNNDHHSLENRIQVLESTERQNASRLVKMEESIIHQHERTIGVEQDLSANITQHGQQIQTLQNKVQLQTNNNEAHLLENRIQVLESAERQNASRLVKMEDSIIHQHERIIGVEQDMSANITQHGQQVQTLQNKENDVLMKSFQSLLTCMVPFIVAFLLSMLSSQSDFGEYEKDLVIQVSLVCGLPGVMAMVFAHLASGPFWTSIVASLTLYFVIYSITLVYYAFIRLLPWSPWTRLQFYATVILLAIFLIVVLTMLIVWGSFVKKPKFTRWIASYFSCCPGPE
jgi:chromosome segregation ATPase